MLSALYDIHQANVYLLRKVCTRVHTLPYLQFKSLLPHIKFSGCKIDVYYSPVYTAYAIIMEQLQLLFYNKNFVTKRHMSKLVDCK